MLDSISRLKPKLDRPLQLLVATLEPWRELCRVLLGHCCTPRDSTPGLRNVFCLVLLVHPDVIGIQGGGIGLVEESNEKGVIRVASLNGVGEYGVGVGGLEETV
jgi:hypothetical protein